jgi:hypothetical protein
MPCSLSPKFEVIKQVLLTVCVHFLSCMLRNGHPNTQEDYQSVMNGFQNREKIIEVSQSR